jgi:fatty-acyl-CoA synthase
VALAAVVAQPDAYAGELPVAFVQLKSDAAGDRDALLADLMAFVRERTPERAAVPVQIFFVDALPLTAVGKVFKPALRLDAARHAARKLLAGLATESVAFEVSVAAHPVFGSLISVSVSGVAPAERAALQANLEARLQPLVLRHEIVWTQAA